MLARTTRHVLLDHPAIVKPRSCLYRSSRCLSSTSVTLPQLMIRFFFHDLTNRNLIRRHLAVRTPFHQSTPGSDLPCQCNPRLCSDADQSHSPRLSVAR